MQLLPSLALLSCLLSASQAFLVPATFRPAAGAAALTRVRSSASDKPSAVEGVMLSTSPLANRKIQFSDNEDSTDRVTQVELLPDGSLKMLSDSTNAVSISGAWRPGDGDKFGFILERFYEEGYSMTRIYECHVTISGNNIRGEGKIETEKYNDLITCGYFSLVSIDDAGDAYFDNLGGGHAVLEGVDQ